MAAYASVISLKSTIERLLNSYHVSLVPPSRKILKSAYIKLFSLQIVVERLDESRSRKRVNALDGQIREAVSKFEDILESHVSNQIAASQSEESIGDESHPFLFSIDLQDLRRDVDSFTETLKTMEEEYISELGNIIPQPEQEDDAAFSSRLDSDGNKPKIVGLSDELHKIREVLTDLRSGGLGRSILGMAGMGKTALAREIFEDPLILSHFEHRLWVTIGRKYQLNEIVRGILAQVNPDKDKMLTEGDEEDMRQYIHESLKGKRYLVVLDDLWDIQVRKYLRIAFPIEHNGSRVLLTTRLEEATRFVEGDSSYGTYEKRFLNKEESWNLLRDRVFGDELCPPHLEKAGKKIAENCDGLPLTIVTVANHLSKAEKTLEYWDKVAEKQNSVFMDAYDEISKVLYSSYEYLPEYLKPCFLYMGVLPQNCEIPRSKLINMWIAEGFLETSKEYAMKCLMELVSNSLVILGKKSSHQIFGTSKGCIKTCRLHSSFWHVCNKEAEKNKFFHILTSCADGLEEGMESQHRLCIHNNILFGIKGMHNSIEDNCSSTARSLLCFGPYHQYTVPICFRLRLLRVLDALTIRFYEFPTEVLKLIQLKYLALTYNGELPVSISKLLNLRFLIIHRHLSIKPCGTTAYVPIEVWDMQELKYIQITGSNLPIPNFGSSLKNLSTLLDVSARSCTKEFLKRIPNLKKLGIQIELAPDDSKPLSCFDHIFRLHKLQSLKCVVVNPELGFEVVALPAPRSMFLSDLQKLHLSGLGYPWEYMSIIDSLPKLQILKLRCYAFRGPKWEIQEKRFQYLMYLLIEDTDLVQLKVRPGSFLRLNNLSIKHCYKLEELNFECDYGNLRKIEVVDSNPSAVTSAKKMTKVRYKGGYPSPDVSVHSSWMMETSSD